MKPLMGATAQGSLALLDAVSCSTIIIVIKPDDRRRSHTAFDQIIKTEPPQILDRKSEKAELGDVCRPTSGRQSLVAKTTAIALSKAKFKNLADLRKRLLSGADETAQTN